jgi:bifunctional oligoribonuclease and PAP phosphatase NrnA
VKAAGPASLEEIGAALRGPGPFVLLSHVRPDGDAIGSQLGLAHALAAAGAEVHVLNEDGLPDSLAFLPGSRLVQTPAAARLPGAVTAIALDTATRERLGAGCLAALEGRVLRWINIDHHVSNPGYGDLVHIDPAAPATGQIVHELLRAAGLPAPVEALSCLFVAISTDTGSFQYSSTSARTFQVAAEMVAAGVDPAGLAADTYHRRPLRKVRLLQHLLDNLELQDQGRVASTTLDLATKHRLGLLPDDSEELINEIRAIDSVVVAVFFEELPGAEGKIRVSSRSKDPAVSVCRVCQRFGGGGHPLAAGARMPGPLASARNTFLQAVHEEIQSQQP